MQKVTGMLVAYATAQGETASDIGEGAGPYARVLAEELVKPGIEVVSMFRNVQVRVYEKIRQEPWLDFGYLGQMYLAGRQRVSIDQAGAQQLAMLETARKQAEEQARALEAARKRLEQEEKALEAIRRQREQAEAERLRLERLKEEELRVRQAHERSLRVCYVHDVRPPDDWLALRTHPNARQGRQLAKLRRGTKIEMLGEQSNAWHKVRAWGQIFGWVSWQKQRWIRC